MDTARSGAGSWHSWQTGRTREQTKAVALQLDSGRSLDQVFRDFSQFFFSRAHRIRLARDGRAHRSCIRVYRTFFLQQRRLRSIPTYGSRNRARLGHGAQHDPSHVTPLRSARPGRARLTHNTIFFVLLLRGTIVIRRTKYFLVKMVKCVDFYVYHSSYQV